MVAVFSSNPLPAPRKENLIKGLQSLPQTWALTPVAGNKAPYRKDWQKRGLPRQQIIAEIKGDRAKGYGLLTGELSDGILAIDADGEQAHALLAKYGELPKTVAFTSGKTGRCQYLLQVPEIFWSEVKTQKFAAGDNQLLELRWNGCQSVLPPSVHPDTKEYKWVNSPDETEIAECPKWVIELILNAGDRASSPPTPVLPVQSAPLPKKLEDIDLPVPASIPLEACLAKETRALLTGVAAGARNESGIKVARDLLGTANYLKLIGQPFDGEPQQLFQDFAARCSPPLPSKETDTIWRSAEKTNPAPACKEEGVNNCLRGWYWTNHLKPIIPPIGSAKPAPHTGNNVVAFPQITKPPLAPIVKEAIAKNPTAEEKREAIRQIESNTGYQLREVEREWREQIRQQQEADELVEARRSLNSLLKQDRLNPFDYLWGDEGKLASAIVGAAEAMPVAPGLVFTTLLPTAAACIGTSSKVVVKSKANYTQPCIFWSVILGRSGQLKTPAQDLVTQPLLDLEIAAAEAYARAEEIYKSDLADWKKDKNGDLEEPTQPKRKRYLTLDATIESLERVHAENPRGIFVFTDELAGEFRSENAHRGGKGADREKKLSQWNGSAIIVDRKERTVALKRSAVNRTGGCQWDIWTELMGTGDDSNGFFCRWLVCGEESPPRYIDLSSGTEDTGIKNLLKSLYQSLERLPDRDYLLSEEAGKFFQTWQHSIVDREKAAKLPAMANLYPKIEAYTSRFALWLHLVNAVLASEDPSPVISGETMERAIALAKYYLHQAESILLTYSPQAGLTGILKQIQDYASKKPDGVKPGKLAAGIKAIRKAIENKQLSTEDLYHHCKRLAEQGYGIFVDGIYKAVDRQLTAVDHRSTTRKTPEITVYQHSEKSDNNSRLTPVDRRSTAETQEYQGIGAKNTVPVDQLTSFENDSTSDSKTYPPKMESPSSIGQPVNSVNQAGETLAERAVAPVNQGSSAVNSVNQTPVALSTPLSPEDLADCLETVRVALAYPESPEIAKVAKDLLAKALSPEEKQQVWVALSKDEQTAFRSLLSDQPSLGISVPPSPPDGNPKGRRLNR